MYNHHKLQTKEMDAAFHEEESQKHCRVCAKRFGKRCRGNYKCSDKQGELHRAFKISVHLDNNHQPFVSLVIVQ